VDDWITARLGMAFFRGIDPILAQDFSTPAYHRVFASGNMIDWWGGKDQGLDYTIFENKDTKDLVIAFRGTEPLSLEDWFEDMEQVLGGSEQYKAAVALAERTLSKIEEQNKKNGTNIKLTYTGHSLGGGLATAAALKTGKQAITFDAAGISNETFAALGLDAKNRAFVVNFNVKGCFVSDWNGMQDETTLGTNETLGKVCKQYGKTFWLKNVNEMAVFIPRGIFARFMKGNAQDVEKKAETFLCHAWHLFTYQIENNQFDREGI
jgi:hypothetical protein